MHSNQDIWHVSYYLAIFPMGFVVVVFPDVIFQTRISWSGRSISDLLKYCMSKMKSDESRVYVLVMVSILSEDGLDLTYDSFV